MHCPKIGKLFVLVNTRKNSCKNLLFKKCESSLIKFLGKSENVLVVRVQPDFVFYFSWLALDLYGNLLFRRVSSMLAFHSLVKCLSCPSEKNSAMLRSTDIENGAPGPPPVIIEWVKFVRYILIVYKQKSNTKTKGVFLYTVNHLT